MDNWEAIGAIAEMLGALAVIITLGYLAIQIRQNTRSTTTSIYESAMDGYVEINRAMLEADIGAVCFKALTDPDSLSELEQFRYSAFIRMWLAHVYKLFRLYEKGILPEDEWETTLRDADVWIEQAAQLHIQFRQENPFFEDLYVEFDRHKSEPSGGCQFEAGI